MIRNSRPSNKILPWILLLVYNVLRRGVGHFTDSGLLSDGPPESARVSMALQHDC